MSFSEDYTEFKVNELKELNVHPEQKDASYKVTSADFKDYGPINTFLMAIVLVPLTFFCLGVVFAPERYHAVEATAEEPVEAAAEDSTGGGRTKACRD